MGGLGDGWTAVVYSAIFPHYPDPHPPPSNIKVKDTFAIYRFTTLLMNRSEDRLLSKLCVEMEKYIMYDQYSQRAPLLVHCGHPCIAWLKIVIEKI